MNKLNDITINRLRVNAPKNDAKQVAFALENQSLLEQYDYRKWVFVRELNVNGNPRELNQKASHLLTQSLQQGVHGGYSAANNANVVYFNNLPELLVFLLQDCVKNSLLNKWYWYAWHQFVPLPKAEQVYTILLENLEHLPTVTALLLEQKMIQPVWQQLTHSSAKQLLVSIQQRQPLDFREFRYRQVNTDNTVVFKHSSPIESLISTSFMQKINAPITALKKVLNGFPKNDGRVQLATELIIRMYTPVVSNDDYRELSALIARSLTEQTPSNVKHNSLKQQVENKTQETYSHKNHDEKVVYLNKTLKNNNVNLPQSKNNQGAPDALDNNDSEKGVDDALAENKIDNDYKEVNKDDAKESTDCNSNPADKLNNENLFEEKNQPDFYTQWGGFFYLINLLKTPKCQQLLAADETTPSAWLWLFDLSRRLSCHLDKPLQSFIAEQMGLESVDELLAWPPIAEVGDVFNVLSQYEKITQNPDQWLGMNAKVFANKSHIDCYFSLDDVQLDIRMMGLDINPGWVPWLGRIVTFYYE